MKRTIIRVLGTCLAVVAALWSRVGMSTTCEYGGVQEHVHYEKCTTRVPSETKCDHYTSNWMYLDSDRRYESVCKNKYPNECQEYTPEVTGGDTILPGPSYTSCDCTGSNEYNAGCLWCECAVNHRTGESSFDGYEPCGPASRCDATGLVCSHGVNGATVNSSGVACRFYESESYNFFECDSGWFRTQSCPSSGSAINDLTGCCSACSGLRIDKDAPGSETGLVVETFVNTGDTNREVAVSGGTGVTYYTWNSTGVGIESCIGYLPANATYSDVGGTYEVASCKYQEIK